ncbi:MAG TPA: SLC13 family permease, partial [Steroidobacteraceae bacterium]|nr:SLC13 family permease [Steroidobacteraceae bacterium]
MPTDAAAIIIFALTYLAMALGRTPGLRLDRTGAALAGAAAMVATGVLPLGRAYRAIDLGTLTLLLGMMIVVANLRLSGFLAAAGAALAARAHHPLVLLAVVVLVTGVLSAFLVNDAVCLVLTPLVCGIAARLRRDPVPYLLAVAMASNAGSVATITGNPQNMIIGAMSHIPYAAFAARLAPIAAVGLAIDFAVVAIAFRASLARETDEAPESSHGSELAGDPAGEPDRQLLRKGAVVLAALVVGFFAGAPVAIVALGAAAVLLLGRVRPERLYPQIDWSLLVMFAGLFVVVGAFERRVVSGWDLAALAHVQRAPVALLTGVSVL